ncbi:MAG: NAD(P)-dependent alcohol dehydrogenase [Cyclobacteriaceae bacterium]|nr:NAD(P)-dependent alcohol dehydrogenase [Cyclobacteriaceae bacterium SS2]
MKAVIFRKYGGPEVLQLVSIPKPKPKENEVLVKIFATTVTAEDPKMRGFNHPPLLKIPVGLMFGFYKPKRPVLGIEFSGVVEDVGRGVKKYRPGDQVFGYTGLSFGAYAEYKCLPEDGMFYLKPKNLTHIQAAAMVNGPLSALAYLKKKAKIKKDDQVLIYGASGSVGTAAVQLAKYYGARVTGICSTRNLDMIRTLEADRVIDYTREDYTKMGDSYDIIFDTVGKTQMKTCMSLLVPKGKYLATEFGFSHILKSITSSISNGKRVIVASSNFYWKREDLKLFKQLAEQGQFTPVVDRVFTLENMREAHRYVEQGHKAGNVAVRICEE